MKIRTIVAMAAASLFAAACGGDEQIATQQPASKVTSTTAPVPTTLVDSMPLGPIGQSTADTPEQRRAEEAAFFRMNLRNSTGTQYLSLTDWAAVRDSACDDGAVNSGETLLALAKLWGLGDRTGDTSAVQSLWVTARNTCPESFENQDFGAGMPFTVEGGESTRASAPEGGPDEFGDRIDTSILDPADWTWGPTEESMFFSSTDLSARETVEHFRGPVADGWVVNEVIGPVTDVSGFTFWSLDIEWSGFSGLVEVYPAPSEADSTTVLIVIVDGPEFGVPFVPAFPVETDGQLDCLTDFTWSEQVSIDPNVPGLDSEQEAMDEFAKRFSRFDVELTVPRDGVISLIDDGREVVLGNISMPPAGGFVILGVRGCEPYRP